MNPQSLFFVLFLLGAVAPTSSFADIVDQYYDSPNGLYVARVIKNTDKNDEITVQLFDKSVRPREPIGSTIDLSSEDGEHGGILEQHEWTPDSQFFIFTSSSSGGHSSWQYGTYIISSKSGRNTTFLDITNLPVISPVIKTMIPATLTMQVPAEGDDGPDVERPVPKIINLLRVLALQ